MPSQNAAYKIFTKFDQKISELSSVERSVELLCRTCLSEDNKENRKPVGKFNLVKMSPTNFQCSKGHHIPPTDEQFISRISTDFEYFDCPVAEKTSILENSVKIFCGENSVKIKGRFCQFEIFGEIDSKLKERGLVSYF